VTARPYAISSTNHRLMRGFYPGVATPGLPLLSPGLSSDAIRSLEQPASDIYDQDFHQGDADDAKTHPSSLPKQGKWTSTRGNANVVTSLSPSSGRAPKVVGSFDHAILPMPPRKTVIPAMDFLSCYAIAVNEVNASGGRIVTSPTNGAAGIIPAVLKYLLEFVSDDHEKSIETFLLTAAAVGMLFKRGSTISAAEGGCQAEVGVACSMASAGFAACMGASPETVFTSCRNWH